MAFTTIDSDTIKVGDPVTKELWDLIKANFDDLDSRQNASETTGGSVFIFNGVIHMANFDSDRPDVFYHKVTQGFDITDFRGQMFAKGSIVTGTLALDLQKATNTNDANFNSILSSDLSFNFASDASYTERVATINTSLNTFAAGDVLRVVVNGLPAGFNDKILVNIAGE